MKKVLYVLLLCLLSLAVYAQDSTAPAATTSADLNLDEADPTKIGADSAEQKLKEISVEKFESEGTWIVNMSADEGVIKGRLFKGAPAGKKPIPEEEALKLTDEMVYGVRVDFFRRGYNSFSVTAAKPLPIEGITKTVSVWVVGRNYGHVINLILEDYWGRQFELYIGKMNHSGWKKMTVAIPPANPDGKNGIIQKDYHFGTNMGLRLVGFRVDCDPMDAYGTYYMYLDDLRAVSDLYEMEARDLDDMFDNW